MIRTDFFDTHQTFYPHELYEYLNEHATPEQKALYKEVCHMWETMNLREMNQNIFVSILVHKLIMRWVGGAQLHHLFYYTLAKTTERTYHMMAGVEKFYNESVIGCHPEDALPVLVSLKENQELYNLFEGEIINQIVSTEIEKQYKEVLEKISEHISPSDELLN